MHRRETDGELVEAVLAGERASFAPLVERHLPRAKALAHRTLASSEAEDIVQEATLQAFLGLRDLRQRDYFGPWFCGIVLNLARMRLRQTRGRLVSLESVDGEVAGADAFKAREHLEAVHEALAGLSPTERETVLLYYVRGLSTPEIATETGEREGTVRVRLHRARRRLRSHLPPPTTRKEKTMIEVEVRDVIVRVASNDDEEGPKLALPQRIVLLGEKDGDGRTLPIWIGPPEGDTLGLHLAGVATPRPTTIDLTIRLLEASGGRVDRVVVSSLRETTFYAVVHVAVDGAAHEIDARPSDGINLAVRVGAPIFVDEKVLAAAGMPASDPETLEAEFAKSCQRQGEDPPPPGEWRSLTPELMSWPPPPGR